MSNTPSELREQLKEELWYEFVGTYMKDEDGNFVAVSDKFNVLKEHYLETLEGIFKAHQDQLLRELLDELPEEIDMKHAEETHSDVGAGYTIGYNKAIDQVSATIKSKLESEES